MKTLISLTIIAGLTLGGAALAQGSVTTAPASLISLNDRWNWALEQAKQQGGGQGTWIAYSIDLLMGEDSWIGSFHSVPQPNDRSLYEIITGRHIENPSRLNSEASLRDQARRALARSEGKEPENKIMKEVALLFRFSGSPVEASSLRTIEPTNVELEVDLNGRPMLWLGKVPQEESIQFLRTYYGKLDAAKQKEKVIVAIGIHKGNSKALDFLETIVNGDDDARVRENATFWIGQQNSKEALDFLLKVVQKDKSKRVSENAVFAISQIDLDAATDALIDLGRNSESRETKKKAVFWLGQRASQKVLETLKDFAYEGDDSEVQKQAVFALSQLSDTEAVAEIIKIARTHPNPKVRKQAIFWLGESKDPRAFDAIVDIAKGK